MGVLVTVITITYNQAHSINKCIDGILMQKVNFPMEFIIADDCSTDGTREICEEYAEKYPDLIRLVTSESNVGVVENEQRAFIAARGKYIATCEGDDFWTDPDKLQKQVDFLESHPDYSVCFHRFRRLHCSDGSLEGDHCDNLFPSENVDGIEISMHQFMHQWCTQYLTMVFRKDCYDFEAYKRYKYFRDTHQIYHLMLNGRCWLFAFEGGVYQMTGDGIYSVKDEFRRQEMSALVSRELWKVNQDSDWRKYYLYILQDTLYHYNVWEIPISLAVKYSFIIFFYSGSAHKFVRNLLRLCR